MDKAGFSSEQINNLERNAGPIPVKQINANYYN
jgi:hypothetical protein